MARLTTADCGGRGSKLSRSAEHVTSLLKAKKNKTFLWRNCVWKQQQQQRNKNIVQHGWLYLGRKKSGFPVVARFGKSRRASACRNKWWTCFTLSFWNLLDLHTYVVGPKYRSLLPNSCCLILRHCSFQRASSECHYSMRILTE